MSCSPLAGKLFDADGQPLYVQRASKGRRRYRYYVSKCLVNGSAGDNGKGSRVSAPEIERTIAIAARHILSDCAGLLEAIENSGIDSPDVRATPPREGGSAASRSARREKIPPRYVERSRGRATTSIPVLTRCRLDEAPAIGCRSRCRLVCPG
jgi:hypothetical protein